MLSETKKAVTRAKALYGFFRIVKYAEWYIRSSAYLGSPEKEKLLKSLDGVVKALVDEQQRAKGMNPELPSEKKAREKKQKETRERLQNL